MATERRYLSLEKLGLYDEKIKKVITDGDATALQSAKDYADSLATNYDAAGAAGTAEANAKSYTDTEVGKANAAAAAAQTTADNAAAAAQTADGKAVTAQGEVDALETFVGTLPEGATATTIVGYIQEKTAGIATDTALGELQDAVDAVEADVEAIKGDYLKAADKTELEGKITTAQNAADSAQDYAEGVETALGARIKTIEDDYLKAADKTELQGNIDTVSAAVERLTNGVSTDEIDGVNDLIAYVNEHGTEVTGMKKDISDNADAISGLEGRVATLEGEMDDVQGAVATKAEQSALESAVEALEGVDAGFETRIAAVEGKLGTGEGSVDAKIATAKQEAIDAAAGDATTKANKALEDAKTYADGLNTSMNTRVEALEAIDHEHSNKALLDTYTQTEADLADAVAKKHAHANATVLDGITSTKVAAWDAAEGNAKTYADGLNTAMDARVVAVETWQANMKEISEEEILALFA